MKRLKRIAFLMALFAFFDMFPVFAGPFGIEMGMSLSELKQVCRTNPKWIKDNVYEIVPPKTHEQFETYYVRIDPDYGVYWLKAIGKDIYTNGYGGALISAFENLVESIRKTYGDRELYQDTGIRKHSYWKKEKYFMQSLIEGDRKMQALWSKSKAFEDLYNSIDQFQAVLELLSDSTYSSIIDENISALLFKEKEVIDSATQQNPALIPLIDAIEEKKKNIKKLPDDISVIGIFSKAISTTKGYVCLEYAFSNEEKVKEKEDSVF